MKIDDDEVGLRLEKLRVALGLEKGVFAKSFGLDASSYSKVIKGEKPLKADYAFEIAQKWTVTMDYLYRGRLTELPANLAEKLRNS
jgi:transcriptional regulator with XRE-family HTH domain